MKARITTIPAAVADYVDRNKLLVWAIGLALVFLLFWEIGDEHQQRIDPYIVLGIGATKQVIVLFMLFYTKRWTWRTIGVMSVMQGVAILYLGSAILSWNREYLPTWREPITDLGRTFLIVGLTPLLFGVIRYAYDRYRGTRPRGHDLDPGH